MVHGKPEIDGENKNNEEGKKKDESDGEDESDADDKEHVKRIARALKKEQTWELKFVGALQKSGWNGALAKWKATGQEKAASKRINKNLEFLKQQRNEENVWRKDMHHERLAKKKTLEKMQSGALEREMAKKSKRGKSRDQSAEDQT